MADITKTFYSINDEQFNHETAGDAFDELSGNHENIVGMEYYSHEFKPVNLKDYLTVENILDDADSYLYDNVGNDDGDWDVFSSVNDEAKSELHALLKNWCDKHLSKHNLYEPVGKSTTHKVAIEDVA